MEAAARAAQAEGAAEGRVGWQVAGSADGEVATVGMEANAAARVGMAGLVGAEAAVAAGVAVVGTMADWAEEEGRGEHGAGVACRCTEAAPVEAPSAALGAMGAIGAVQVGTVASVVEPGAKVVAAATVVRREGSGEGRAGR